jgi:hypothetical protein
MSVPHWFLVTLFALCWAALQARAEHAPAAAASVMIDEDMFASGSSIEIDRRVDGDAFLAGGRVAVRAPVKGDVAVAGGDVHIADTVGQDLYAAGGSVALSAQVVGNARLAGAHVTLSPRGGVGGRAIVAADTLTMSGRVGRYLVVYAQTVRINGEVGGDLRITARSIEIGPDAKIGGKLQYRSAQPASIDPHASILGGISRNALDWPREEMGAFARAFAWISLVLLLLGTLMVGLLLIAIFPRFTSAAGATVRTRPWAAAAVGFALVLCVPVAALLLLVSFIGAPFGLLLLFVYPAWLMLGYLIGVLAIADRAVAWWARKRGRNVSAAARMVALAIALLLLWLAAGVPVAGVLLACVLLLLGLGAAAIEAYRRYAAPFGPSPENMQSV